MPIYEYRCQECRATFGIERSMNDSSTASCAECNSKNVSRIWNATILTGGTTPDAGKSAGTAQKPATGGCGSGSAHSCGSCH